MRNTGITLPNDMVEEIDDRRHSTVSRAAWIRGAIKGRFRMEDAGDWFDDLDDTGSESEAPADD